uniref:hypothetical protein n=1 Tax=Dissulfurimicrobium sp. TaxID=2022436 RepID=UPI00404A5477
MAYHNRGDDARGICAERTINGGTWMAVGISHGSSSMNILSPSGSTQSLKASFMAWWNLLSPWAASILTGNERL